METGRRIKDRRTGDRCRRRRQEERKKEEPLLNSLFHGVHTSCGWRGHLKRQTQTNCSCASTRTFATGHCWGQAGINHRRAGHPNVDLSLGTITKGPQWAVVSLRRPIGGGGWGQSVLNGQWPAVTHSLLVCRIMDSGRWCGGLWEQIQEQSCIFFYFLACGSSWIHF